MIRLRLVKGISHANAYVAATQKNPIVTVESEEAATACVAGGFFEIVSVDDPASADNVQEETASLNAANIPANMEAANTAVEANGIDGTDEGDELDSMTVAELRAYADTTGVNLGKLTKKSDIISAIRDAESE